MEETIEPVAPIHRRPRNLESVQYLARERRLARQQRALRRAEAREAKKAKATIAAAHKAVAEIVAQQDGMPGSENWTENEWQAWADSLKVASSGIMSWQNWTNEILYGTGTGSAPGLMNALVKPYSATVTSALATGETTAKIPVAEVGVSLTNVAKWQIEQMNATGNWTQDQWQKWADSLKTATSGYATAYWTPNVSGSAPGLMNALVKPYSATVTSAQATGETKTLVGVYDPVVWKAADTALSYVNKLNAESQHLKFTSTTNADGSCTVTYEIV